MKSAVIVIDLQVGLFDKPGKPYEYENTIERINRLTARARKNRVPVVFVQHEQAEGTLKYNSPGWVLVRELTSDPLDYRVRKTTPNSFLRTNLQELLEREGVNNLIVCGYATEYCVDSTVRAAAALGYSVQIVADGHTTHDKNHAPAELIRKHHNETLSSIKSFGVVIQAIRADEIIKHMEQAGPAD
ncbi:cysteine hydrolase family protein [Desulfopila aestuarii]|uniref:Nicotinamidase-related amidase n=1 Tax=Desulfopila aestuarii DSM 18488 TaxID=1121416 RepID=A0A1M7Y4U8_9BACT|nr:cysteine hydrolase family protein [Desulfopila aestuarii]SHO47309.1 Nicotinamidase-related amidase [Desulfopila aestuarii DSM 18488]